jgi:hypothetical protein
MLHPTTPANRINKEFSVADIENRSNGEVLAIGFFDGYEYRRFVNWEEWLRFLSQSKAKNHKTIYAHNGSGWDWLSLLQYVVRNTDYKFDSIQNGNRLVCIMLTIDGVRIRLLDSLFMLQCSLDQAANRFLGKGKLPLEHLPEWYYENNPGLFELYLKADCTLLYDVLSAFCDTVYTKVAPIRKLGITLPSTAMKVFQTSFLPKSIGTPSDEGLKKALRLAYCGGRVEVFRQGYHPKINVYDVNSLYPSVMASTPVPISGNARRVKRLQDGCGVYLVDFEQDRGIPVLMVDGLGSYKGRGWYFANELRRLQTVGVFTVLDGYAFNHESVLFAEYVKTLYALRMTDKDGALGGICKLLMNSLYGKFGQKPERAKTCILTFAEVKEYIQNGCKVETLSENDCIYRVTEEKEALYEHVGIAGTITSEARARLWEFMDKDTVYCDTDSVHTPNEMKTGSGLGEMKLEFRGSGAYAGKKLYALHNEETEKIRAKGIKVGGKLGCRLTFSDLRNVASGATIVCNFSSPNTVNGVMKGKQSCQMQPKTRTIRNTVKPR